MTEPNGLTSRRQAKGWLAVCVADFEKLQGCAQDFRHSGAICRLHYAQDYVINRVANFGH